MRTVGACMLSLLLILSGIPAQAMEEVAGDGSQTTMEGSGGAVYDFSDDQTSEFDDEWGVPDDAEALTDEVADTEADATDEGSQSDDTEDETEEGAEQGTEEGSEAVDIVMDEEAGEESAEEEALADEESLEDDASADALEEATDALTVQSDDPDDAAATSLEGATVSASQQTYTGKTLTPAVTVKLEGTTLVKDTDYTVAYAKNVNVGTASITVTGKGNYTGTATGSFSIVAASISSATVANVNASYAYTGKAITPTPKVSLAGTTLTVTRDYTVSYSANTNAGTATITLTGKGNYTGTKTQTFKIVTPTVTYMARVQGGVNQTWRNNGQVAGTSSKGKRIEGIRLKLAAGFPVEGGITYRAYMQSSGWQDWRSNGKLAGTTNKKRRVEAVQIKLTGTMAKKYDVYYRTHVQNVGWMNWAKNGQTSGTYGMHWRVEALQVVLVAKGQAAPRKVADISSQTSLRAFRMNTLRYRSWVQGTRWQGWRKTGAVSGTKRKSKRVTGIKAKLNSTSSIALQGSLYYKTRSNGKKWSSWSSDGKLSGKAGGSTRVEAIRFKLKGSISKYVDIWYRAYVQDGGWLGWAKNGEAAGTNHAGLRLEAYQVKLLPKGSAAPGSTNDCYITKAQMRLKTEQNEPMYRKAQGYHSPTSWLILVDCITCRMAIFKGSQGNWHIHDLYYVGVGKATNPSRHGVWSIGGRGYSFGHGYTCYYWVQYYNDYLFHSIKYNEGTFDVQDGTLGAPCSMGCVRQPLHKAKWLYDNIPYGTTVVVYDS